MRFHRLWVHWLLFLGSALGLILVKRATLPLWASCVLLVGLSVLLVNAGLPLARYCVRNVAMTQNSASQAAVFAMIGTVFATLVAFAVVVVWENYADAESTVAQEANALADLERMSRGFAVPVRRQVQEASRTYATIVIGDEWDAMTASGADPRAHAALTELWTVYTDMGPDGKASPLYQPSIERMNSLGDNRRLRLLAARSEVPTVVWLMLYCGGVLSVVMVYFFGVRRDWVQRLVVSVLATVVALSVFLVASLEKPFGGDAGIGPDAFESVVASMQNLEM
ncbi:hypothetical protein ACIO3O_36755 [Streptomyces sp. NPDC087440]|uniref:bestrophin-like domain n=1 Tax=Streptomyces sp. NPDC087440 TaxID=3365790 RepID=UPI0037FD431E